MDSFGISVTTVKRYLKETLDAGIIEAAYGEECPYRLIQKEYRVSVSLEESGIEEDVLYDCHIAPYLKGCNEKARSIWQYCCSEILNNAIEHSKGTHLAAYASKLWKESTMVMMTLENETERKAGKIFDTYSDVDEGFVKTLIPVKEACISGEPVARSQARRICNRLDEFQKVVLDFSNVTMMGQGFADELFRVYAEAHPAVMLCPVNMLPQIERMIRHVRKGYTSENIIFPSAD